MNNEYGTLEIQEELLKMMKRIHDFMSENKINYSLCGGTLLGAIRHNGFIPWDDDFDIVMTRRNFEIFCSKYNEMGNKPYNFERDGWVWRIRNRKKMIAGVYPTIDFFIMDPIPENKIIYHTQIVVLRVLQGLLKEHYYWSRYSNLYKVCLIITHYIGKIFSGDSKFRVYNNISKWGYKKPSDKCSQLNDQFRIIRTKYDANIMDKYELKSFEDTEFMIIKRYNHYLKTQYGDYMVLPPVEDRKPMHGREE